MRCGAYQQASDRKMPSHIKLLPAQHVAPACRPGGCIAKFKTCSKTHAQRNGNLRSLTL